MPAMSGVARRLPVAVLALLLAVPAGGGLGAAEEPLRIITPGERRGVFFAGYGFPEDSFEYVFAEIMAFLLAHDVKVVNPPVEAGPYRMNLSSLNYFRENLDTLNADSLLFLRVEAPERKSDLISLLCFDAAGQLLWEEALKGTIEMSYRRASQKMIKKIKKRLEKHLFDPHLPIEYTLKPAS